MANQSSRLDTEFAGSTSLETGADMIRAWMNNHSFRRRLSRGIACGLATAVSVGVIVVAGIRGPVVRAGRSGTRRAPSEGRREKTTSVVRPGQVRVETAGRMAVRTTRLQPGRTA